MTFFSISCVINGDGGGGGGRIYFQNLFTTPSNRLTEGVTGVEDMDGAASTVGLCGALQLAQDGFVDKL